MKIHVYTVIVIIYSLFRLITGVNVTERSVQEGETFIFHLPHMESGRSVEWKQMNQLLAIIILDNPNKTVIFHQGHRLQFMQNGSIVIRDVKQEDTGNYTCTIIFKDNKIHTHILSLTLYPETTEQSPTYNSMSTTSVPLTLNKLHIVIVISSLGGLLLLGIVIIIVLKCRRKRRTWEEPIYSNTYHRRKGNPRTCGNKVTGDQKQMKS